MQCGRRGIPKTIDLAFICQCVDQGARRVEHVISMADRAIRVKPNTCHLSDRSEPHGISRMSSTKFKFGSLFF